MKLGKIFILRVKYVFFGYYKNTKSYRLYNPKIHKEVVFRDVIFNEWGIYDHQKTYVNDGISGTYPSIHPYMHTNLQIIYPIPPTNPSKSPKQCTSSPSSSDGSPNIFLDVIKKKRGGKVLQIHPPTKVLDNNFHRRLTRGQAQEINQVFHILEKIHMYGDEDKGDPNFDVVNYDLMIISNFVHLIILNKLILIVFGCKVCKRR